MTDKIHFEDDIFYLRTFVRTIEDGLKLRIDNFFFADKMFSDILYIDQMIQDIYTALSSRENLIRRFEHMHSLMRLKRSYTALINIFVTPENSFSDNLSQEFPKLRRIEAVHEKDIVEIRNHLKEISGSQISSDIISYAEMDTLMGPMSFDEEE